MTSRGRDGSLRGLLWWGVADRVHLCRVNPASVLAALPLLMWRDNWRRTGYGLRSWRAGPKLSESGASSAICLVDPAFVVWVETQDGFSRVGMHSPFERVKAFALLNSVAWVSEVAHPVLCEGSTLHAAKERWTFCKLSGLDLMSRARTC